VQQIILSFSLDLIKIGLFSNVLSEKRWNIYWKFLYNAKVYKALTQLLLGRVNG